jgi:hypothetical protein
MPPPWHRRRRRSRCRGYPRSACLLTSVAARVGPHRSPMIQQHHLAAQRKLRHRTMQLGSPQRRHPHLGRSDVCSLAARPRGFRSVHPDDYVHYKLNSCHGAKRRTGPESLTRSRRSRLSHPTTSCWSGSILAATVLLQRIATSGDHRARSTSSSTTWNALDFSSPSPRCAADPCDRLRATIVQHQGRLQPSQPNPANARKPRIQRHHRASNEANLGWRTFTRLVLNQRSQR